MSPSFVLKPGESRGAGLLQIFGDQLSVKLSGHDTNQSYAVMETSIPPRSGPPLHRHGREDEYLYVLEGEFLFEVDGLHIQAGPGSSVFAPRGTAHTFQNVGKTPGRMLVVVQPAGLDAFFTELSAATAGMSQPAPALIVPIFQKYGLELLGPPIAARPMAG